MILQVDTHRLVFAALIHDRILPNIQDFDDEFVTIDRPKNNPRHRKRLGNITRESKLSR
jgi:hypothetical protein